MNQLMQKILKFIFSKFLKSRYPGWESVFKNLPLVFDLAQKVVVAAEEKGGTGEQKKAAATQSLLSLLKENKIDIPGEHDKEICAVLVEVVVETLNNFF